MKDGTSQGSITKAIKKAQRRKKRKQAKKRTPPKQDFSDIGKEFTADTRARVAEEEEIVVRDEDSIWIPDYDPALSIEDNLENVKMNPGKQARFLSSPEDWVLYTGGRGSAKSEALIVDPLPQVTNPNFRGVIIRNTMPELQDLIARADKLYKKILPGTQWKANEKKFVFPSGAIMEFGYCEKKQDLGRYQGQQYVWIGIDEAGNFPWEDLIPTLWASCRTTDPTLKCYIRLTSNANGPGRAWLKKMFIDRAEPEKTIYDDPDDRENSVTLKHFDSNIFDNKVLCYHQPKYVAGLKAIKNEALREQWLNNNWSFSEDAAFSEFDKKIHVCKPFDIPYSWYRAIGVDWGFSSMGAALWGAVSPEGKLYIYREKIFRKQDPDVVQDDINRLSADEHITRWVLDGSAWSTRGEMGETPGDTLMRCGGRYIPADRSKGSRKAGKMLVHQFLNHDNEKEEPSIYIFDTCEELINELETLCLDPNDPEDVDTSKKASMPDHAYDALRYILLSRLPCNPGSGIWGGFRRSRPTPRRQPVNVTFGY